MRLSNHNLSLDFTGVIVLAAVVSRVRLRPLEGKLAFLGQYSSHAYYISRVRRNSHAVCVPLRLIMHPRTVEGPSSQPVICILHVLHIQASSTLMLIVQMPVSIDQDFGCLLHRPTFAGTFSGSDPALITND
jgi:hypothetical protein